VPLHLDKPSEVDADLEVFEEVRLQVDPSWKTKAMLEGYLAAMQPLDAYLCEYGAGDAGLVLQAAGAEPEALSPGRDAPPRGLEDDGLHDLAVFSLPDDQL
jgi:hypothetical protein